MNNCIDIEKIFAEADGDSLTEKEMRHIENCAECKALYNEILLMQQDARAMADVEVPKTLVPKVMRQVKDIRRTRRIKVFTASAASVLCVFVLTFSFLMAGGVKNFGASPRSENYGPMASDSPQPTASDFTCGYRGLSVETFDGDTAKNPASGGIKVYLSETEGEVYNLLLQAYNLSGLSPEGTYAVIFSQGEGEVLLQICSAEDDSVLAKFRQE